MRAFFDKIAYITTYGEVIDISDMVSEISIFQSLFSHYMQCEIVLNDAIDLSIATPQNFAERLNGGFSGGEMLVLHYTSEANEPRINTFALYERSNRTKVRDTMESYIFSGISLEALEAYPRKISRAYGMPAGNTISKMMKSLVNEYVYSKNIQDFYSDIKNITHLAQEKFIITEETSGLQKFVIPNLSVDDTIEFFCNEADSGSYVSRYLFWERYEGFFFYNLTTLAEASPIFDYYYTEFNTDFVDRDQRKIISYEIKKETNFLENARDGMYKSKTIHLDVLKKRKKETVFDYQTVRKENKFKTLQPFYHGGEVDTPDVNTTLITTRQGHDCQCIIFKEENHLPKRIDRLLAPRKSYSKHLFNTVISVVVPGTTMINAGDCITLHFPIKSLVNAKGGDDIQLSGKYIVTDVRNKFNSPKTGSHFVTIMECVKDTQILGD